ncbi:HD domain-containing protein [Desulfatibacillum alkenivorans DSM 16219]|jgi:HD-GYP domain-containing protein (c-di-GMP phosphodiesterase class II)|uniref:HD domain-containing protein n=1 Tax=Desulfatibacillum alkenivorans DSM 16219 TaxID=1121393 RepID=A0A1M6XDZ0_9BACT|nr:HD domain-containing phosphohydrolase [Desulfatibacillum alkenivorans]SHL04138.1 HD domain-containing protein [Desulfatibacillum alkenivorans DSM 16219]
MEKMSLKELAVPMIKAIDSFNFLLKSHHRRTAVISYYIGKELHLKDDELTDLVLAAALHDIGALSVQEKKCLIEEDVLRPSPHCLMGCKMLSSFDAFGNIARIIKHHHVKYEESRQVEEGEILFQSHIVHLADRCDILVNPDLFILNQKKKVVEKIREKSGTLFHPRVFRAFEQVAKKDIFWIEINYLTMDQLFRRIDFSIDYELSVEKLVDFARTISRIIDFRSRFTASHSYTVAHLAYLISGYFGFSEERRTKMMIAGYLHDIGKLGVDPALIEKEGGLTDEEFNLVKLHTYFTSQILSELSSSVWFHEIVLWAERHHEKSDGSGYPFALDDSSLDEGVKILAFSDIISALMEERPYRKGMPSEEAFDLIGNMLADRLSPEMFVEIDNHRDEIEDMVKQCYAHSFEEYYSGRS